MEKFFTFTDEKRHSFFQLVFSDEIEEETGYQVRAGYISMKDGSFEISEIWIYQTYEEAKKAYFNALATY